MSVTHPTAFRNTVADLVDSTINGGGAARIAALVTHDTSGVLVAQSARIVGASLNGTIVYASAPSGSGYSRKQASSDRPRQRNTVRR